MERYKVLSRGANSIIHPALPSLLSCDGWHAVTYPMRCHPEVVLEYCVGTHTLICYIQFGLDARLWDPCELPHTN